MQVRRHPRRAAGIRLAAPPSSDALTWTALIGGYAAAGATQDALGLFRAMLASRRRRAPHARGQRRRRRSQRDGSGGVHADGERAGGGGPPGRGGGRGDAAGARGGVALTWWTDAAGRVHAFGAGVRVKNEEEEEEGVLRWCVEQGLPDLMARMKEDVEFCSLAS